MDEIIRICLPFMGAFDLTDDNYRLLARRISDTPQGHSCLLNPKVHVSPCDYFWLHKCPHTCWAARKKGNRCRDSPTLGNFELLPLLLIFHL